MTTVRPHDYDDFVAHMQRRQRRAHDRGDLMPNALDPRSRIAALRDGKHRGVAIRNAKESKTAEVYLYDVIGDGFFFGVSAADFVRELQGLEDDVEEIQLHINSPGGDAFDGIAILNALRNHDARVVCTVDGLAASAASFIAVGSDELVMARNSEMMIHDAWGLVIGNAADMHDFAETLDKLSDNIASIYAEDGSAEASTEEWREAMRAETWYTAEEAVEAGLANKVAEKKKSGGSGKDDDAAKDRFDLSIFTYAGREQAPAPHMPPAASASGSRKTHERRSAVAFTDEQMTTMRQKLGLAEDADEATIIGAFSEALDEHADPPPPDPSKGDPTVPEGHVVVPEARLKDLEESARAGVDVAAKMRVKEREEFLDSVRTKFAPSNREAWAKEYDRDPEGTREHFESAPVIVPVDQLGHDGDPSATSHGERDRTYYDVFPEEKKAS